MNPDAPSIPPLKYDEAPPASRKIWDEQVAAHGRMTNMKMTMARDPLSLRVMMEWYPLRDQVAAFTSDRAATIFAHAVSSASDCLICSTFFRRILMDAGENPDQLTLDAEEQLLVNFGRALAAGGHGVSAELRDELLARYRADQIVALTTFGAMMLATNVFNNALKVNLDDYLAPYRGLIKDK